MKTIYVDAAASALKPSSVINAQTDFLTNNYANAGRGVCARAAFVDSMIYGARESVAKFIGAKNPDGVVFTSGTTDGFNRIAQMLEKSGITPDSTVVVSDLDHHSARIPFEEMARRGKCKIWVCPLTDDFQIDVSALRARCKIGDVVAVVITAMSNVIGVGLNVKEIIAATRNTENRPLAIIDAAQYVAHEKTDVADWDADACLFSGHKIGADTGIGVMYLKSLDNWAPSDFGGGMVSDVFPDDALGATSGWTLASGSARFEAGTLPLTQIAGLVAAIDAMGTDANDGRMMTKFLRAHLSDIPRIKFISPPDSHILTFTVDGMHPLDFGTLAGAKNVCLRVGNCCASWLHRLLGTDGSIRISVGPWNTMDEMSELVEIIKKIVK